MITGQAKNTSIDVNGNLRVEVEYTLTDGSKISENLSYSCFGFTKELLLNDIKHHCEGLIYKEYSKNQNSLIAATLDITDVTYQCSSVDKIISGKDEPVVTVNISDAPVVIPTK